MQSQLVCCFVSYVGGVGTSRQEHTAILVDRFMVARKQKQNTRGQVQYPLKAYVLMT